MTARIAVIPGDGIGREVVAEAGPRSARARRARARGSCRGARTTTCSTGITVPPGGYDTLRSFDAIFVGALGDPRVPDNRHARDILLGTRFELDLYVNYRPVRLLDDRLCPLKNRTRDDVNFVVFRENTEGLYVGAGGRMRRTPTRRSRSRKRSTRIEVCTASSGTRSNLHVAAGIDAKCAWRTRATR